MKTRSQLSLLKCMVAVCAAAHLSSAYCADHAVIEIPACPESVTENSIKLENIPPGWMPYVARPLYLSAAAPIDGPPERRGELADFEERKNKQQTTYTYRFEGAYPDGKWLECSYGEYGQVTLSRRMDDRVQKCEFTYRAGAKAGQKSIKIRCS